MREAIGGTWLFQIVIFFILLFTGFMCLSINRSKAFNVKNQIVETIQSYNGINTENEYSDGEEGTPIADIVSYLKENSYRTTGVVPADETVNGESVGYVCFSRDGQTSTNQPVFCIAKIDVSKDANTNFSELPSEAYYRVVVFYQLDLPVFHDLFNFKVVGDTKTLYGGVIS